MLYAADNVQLCCCRARCPCNRQTQSRFNTPTPYAVCVITGKLLYTPSTLLHASFMLVSLNARVLYYLGDSVDNVLQHTCPLSCEHGMTVVGDAVDQLIQKHQLSIVFQRLHRLYTRPPPHTPISWAGRTSKIQQNWKSTARRSRIPYLCGCMDKQPYFITNDSNKEKCDQKLKNKQKLTTLNINNSSYYLRTHTNTPISPLGPLI